MAHEDSVLRSSTHHGMVRGVIRRASRSPGPTSVLAAIASAALDSRAQIMLGQE